jgi:hypothetical protein
MAQSNWFNWDGSNNTSDPSNFNYDVQAQKVKRARDAATALQQLSMQDNKGQFVQSGVGTFYAGGNNMATTAAKLLAAYLGTQANSNADQSQQDLSNNSLTALQKQYAGLNSPTRDPAQDGVEAAAQDQREIQRFQSNPNSVQPAATPSDSQYPQMPPIRQDGASAATPLPPVQATAAPVKSVSPSVKKAAAKALASAPIDVGTGGNSWDAPAASPQGASDEEGMISSLFNQGIDSVNGAVGSALKKGVKWFTGTDDPAPQATPPAPAASQAMPPMPQAAQAPLTPQAMPPMPAAPQAPQPPAALPPSPPQASAPGMGQLSVGGTAGQNPFSSAPQQTPGQDQLTNGTNVQTSNPTPYNLPPSQQDLVARLIALGRTGPEGQQIANAQLNQMFASKNGRFETKVMADPVNGGFVQVTTDTATGQTLPPVTIGANGGKMVTGQTTDANGNRLNMHRDGSTSPMVDGQNNPVKDASAVRSNTEAVTSIVGKRSEAQAKLADLTKMESDLSLASGLVGQANVGPLASNVGGVYNKYIGNSTANDTLDRVLNDSRLQQILQDKGGNGSVGAGLMRAYAGHSMSRDLSPSALSQGLGQALSTVHAQRQALQAEIGAHNYSLGQLGYQDPAASAAPAVGGARPAGNYTF